MMTVLIMLGVVCLIGFIPFLSRGENMLRGKHRLNQHKPTTLRVNIPDTPAPHEYIARDEDAEILKTGKMINGVFVPDTPAREVHVYKKINDGFAFRGVADWLTPSKDRPDAPAREPSGLSSAGELFVKIASKDLLRKLDLTPSKDRTEHAKECLCSRCFDALEASTSEQDAGIHVAAIQVLKHEIESLKAQLKPSGKIFLTDHGLTTVDEAHLRGVEFADELHKLSREVERADLMKDIELLKRDVIDMQEGLDLAHKDLWAVVDERDRYRKLLSDINDGKFKYYEQYEGDTVTPSYYDVIDEALKDAPQT